MDRASQRRGVDVDVLRTYKQQCVTCLQHYLSRYLINALTTSGDSYQHQIVILLKRTTTDGRSYQVTAKVDIGSAQLTIRVQLTHGKDMMVGTHQLVVLRHLQNLVDLSGIYQMVTSHDNLVLIDGRRDIVEVIHFYQATAIDMKKIGLGERLTDIRIVRRHLQFHSILARGFESILGGITFGQQTAHGNDRQYADGQTEQARDGGGQYVHRFARLLLVESADDQVRRRTDKGADTAHTRGITQGNQQFGG